MINETFLNTFLRTQKSGFALKSAFLSEFALLRAFLSAQKSTQGPTEPLCVPPPNADNLLCLLESSRQMHITEDRKGRKSSIAASANF